MDNLCHPRILSDEDLAAEGMSKNPRRGLTPASFVVDDLLVHHVATHQGHIRRNVSRFDEARAKP